MKIARRMARMGSEGAFAVHTRALELERAGRDVIHLELGQPDIPTPPHVVEAAIRALRDGQTGYAPPGGLPELREALARDVAASRGLAVDPSQVVVCPGAKPAIFFTFLALVEEGDEVVLPDPGFPIYASMARAMGARVRTYDPGSGESRRPDLDRLASLLGERTRLLVLNSPGNPTGVVHREEELRGIAAMCRDLPLHVLSDEIYSRIVYGVPHRSIASVEGMAERTILVDGFSKTWSMTGWRLGHAVLPRPLAPLFEKLITNSVSCAVRFVQRAALAALEGPQDGVARMVATFRDRRDLLMKGLQDLPGLSCDRPEGAFYAFVDARERGPGSGELAHRLLEEGGVAAVSGADFGPRGEGFLRLSLTRDAARIAEAVARLRNLLGA